MYYQRFALKVYSHLSFQCLAAKHDSTGAQDVPQAYREFHNLLLYILVVGIGQNVLCGRGGGIGVMKASLNVLIGLIGQLYVGK